MDMINHPDCIGRTISVTQIRCPHCKERASNWCRFTKTYFCEKCKKTYTDETALKKEFK